MRISLSRKKCELLVDRIQFLRQVVDKSGIRPNPAKVTAMIDMPMPRHVTEVEAFVRTVNYDGKFIRGLAVLAAPMNKSRRTDEPFVWGPEQNSAFEEIKRSLVKTDFLVHYDPDTPVVLATDASEYGLGAVIFHKYPDASEKVIAYASRTLKNAERNCALIDKGSARHYLWCGEIHTVPLWSKVHVADGSPTAGEDIRTET